jgi:hypothetical protein
MIWRRHLVMPKKVCFPAYSQGRGEDREPFHREWKPSYLLAARKSWMAAPSTAMTHDARRKLARTFCSQYELAPFSASVNSHFLQPA